MGMWTRLHLNLKDVEAREENCESLTKEAGQKGAALPRHSHAKSETSQTPQ